MNKQDLVEVLSTRLQQSQKDASESIDALLDEIKKALAKGEAIRISGFGAFEQSVRAARQGRNPRTGEAVKIKATRVVRFRPAADFKAIVAGTRKAVANAVPGGDSGKSDDEAPLASAPAVKKIAAKRAPAKKATAVKKTAVKKAAAKTTAAKTTAAKTTAAKTTAAKTTAAKKTTTATAKKTTTRAAKKTPAASAE